MGESILYGAVNRRGDMGIENREAPRASGTFVHVDVLTTMQADGDVGHVRLGAPGGTVGREVPSHPDVNVASSGRPRQRAA